MASSNSTTSLNEMNENNSNNLELTEGAYSSDEDEDCNSFPDAETLEDFLDKCEEYCADPESLPDEKDQECDNQSHSFSKAETLEAGRASELRISSSNTTLINVTPQEVLKQFLKYLRDDPCKRCGSDQVGHKDDNAWICSSCNYPRGYGSLAKIVELVQKFRFASCPSCQHDDMYSIRFVYFDGNIEFWCKGCGTEYNSQSKTQDKTVSKSALKDLEASGNRRSVIYHETVRQNSEIMLKVIGRSMCRYMSARNKIMTNASLTQSDRKRELDELRLKEIKGLCVPMLRAFGTVLGSGLIDTLLGRSLIDTQRGAYTGAWIGTWMGRRIRKYIS